MEGTYSRRLRGNEGLVKDGDFPIGSCEAEFEEGR